jgi:hypothetical protein
MRRPWLLAAALAAGAVAVAVIALLNDSGSSAPTTPAGFSDVPVGRKPMIFDIGATVYTPDASVRKRTLADVRALGADAVRVPVLWNVVAPDALPADFQATNPREPSYDWSVYDQTITAAVQRGLKILLMPTGPAPEWAAKPGSGGVADPDPDQFGEFVSALAKRYDGHFDPGRAGDGQPLPKVNLWTIWNEPNLSTFLQPQKVRDRPYSPLIYRRLYLAAQAAIHSQDPGAPILIGETAPTGGEQSVDPLTFTRQTLCLNGDFQSLPNCPGAGEKIDAVGWSTHPYPLVGQPPFEPVSNPHFVTMSSLSALEATLGGAEDAGALPSDFPIYVTEFGVQSYPDPNAVSLEQQAADIGIAEQFAYNDPNVVTFAQYLMTDDIPESVPGQLYGGFESGLRLSDGRKKPSYDAFRLPLAVQRLGDTVSLWGIVQPYPHPTTVKIRFKNPGRPARTLQTLNTNDVGVYTTTYGDTPGRTWQAVWHSPLDGHTYRSPWIRSYEYAQPIVG